MMVFDLLKPAAEQEEREFEVSCGRFLSFPDLTRGVVGFFADVCLRPISRSEWREHTLFINEIHISQHAGLRLVSYFYFIVQDLILQIKNSFYQRFCGRALPGSATP